MTAAKKIKITQIASAAGRIKAQIATIKGLGLGRLGKTVERADTPEIRGMIRAVAHLVKIEE
ncbi:MAG: 50S ribosomal protein L30 [Alphaproteobacteria bacterium]|nr:50S ribosomal protein L30 [Alphaproteobacteria bacterium]